MAIWLVFEGSSALWVLQFYVKKISQQTSSIIGFFITPLAPLICWWWETIRSQDALSDWVPCCVTVIYRYKCWQVFEGVQLQHLLSRGYCRMPESQQRHNNSSPSVIVASQVFFFLPRQPVRSNEHGTLWCSELMMETHNLWMLREMSPYANQKKPPRMNLKERDLGDRPWELLNC